MELGPVSAKPGLAFHLVDVETNTPVAVIRKPSITDSAR